MSSDLIQISADNDQWRPTITPQRYIPNLSQESMETLVSLGKMKVWIRRVERFDKTFY